MAFYLYVRLFFKSYVLRQETVFLAVLALFCLDIVTVRHSGTTQECVSGLQLLAGSGVTAATAIYQPNLSKPALAFVLALGAGFFVSIWRPAYHHGYVFLFGMGAIACLFWVPYQIASALGNPEASVETLPPFLLMAALLVASTGNAYLQGIKPNTAPPPGKPDIHINIITSRRGKP